MNQHIDDCYLIRNMIIFIHIPTALSYLIISLCNIISSVEFQEQFQILKQSRLMLRPLNSNKLPRTAPTCLLCLLFAPAGQGLLLSSINPFQCCTLNPLVKSLLQRETRRCHWNTGTPLVEREPMGGRPWRHVQQVQQTTETFPPNATNGILDKY